eukprot:c24669_g1_i1 orf=1628-2926(-)
MLRREQSTSIACEGGRGGDEMKRSSTRLWSELRKESSRSSNLVWVVALLIWLALSSSWYSHWHSLSHHLLHSTWFPLSHTTRPAHHIHHHPLPQHMPLPSSDPSTSWVPLHQLNYLHTEFDPSRRSASLSAGQQDGINVSTIPDNDDDNHAHYEHGSHREDGVNENIILVDDAHLLDDPDLNEKAQQTHNEHGSHQEDGINENIVLKDDTHRLDDLELNEKAQQMHDYNESRGIETLGEQNRLDGVGYQAPYEVQNDQARPEPSQTCASVEEMGRVAAGNVADSSLRVRKMIKNYLSLHGASRVRDLPAEKFCRRGFVFGRAAEDGLGNDIYKILTASGLSIMLNRSLIIAEHSSTNPAYFGLAGRIRLPFGEYLRYSNQTFSLSEVKRLWVKHDCAGVFQRPLTMIVDDFQRPTRTKVFCEDWAKWKHPII